MDALITGSDGELAAARDVLAGAIGAQGAADVSSVAAQFQTMTRIADSTGIPLDPIIEMAGRDIRDKHGVGDLSSAGNTPTPHLGQRIAGWLMAPFRRLAFKMMAKKTPTEADDVEAMP